MGGRVRQGTSPPRKKGPKKTIVKEKQRVFLSKDQQALLIVEYNELPKAGKKGDGAARTKALEALCKKYDVNTAYPRKLIAKLKETKLLPTRDGVGGAPERITEEEEVRLKDTLRENGYDLTYRQLETLTGIPSSTIWRLMKENKDKWREVSKRCRPLLSDANVVKRMEYAELHEGNRFVLHLDLDEKLFYAYSFRGKLKVPTGDEVPKARLQSKRYIPKVMMLACVGRPDSRYAFDGKVGIWEIGEERPAKRGDRRTGLKKGDPVWEGASLDGEKWVEMLVDKVFPAIRVKLRKLKVVQIQFDNAPGHKTGKLDKRIEAELTSARPHIEIVEQAPQSPCTNLCDLGFFNSIDSRLPKLRSFKLPAFIQQIRDAFDEYPSETLESLADTKCRVVDCIRKAKGQNDFKLPHRKTHVEN